MKISTKGRYALRIMIDLSNNPEDEFIPLKEISKRQGITVKYMEQIIPMLIKSGFLKSLRGNNGGYKLSKKPSEYSVGDILRSVEGNLAPVSCLENQSNDCDNACVCPTLNFWQGLYGVINEYVNSYTLEDLIKNSK